MTSDDILIFLQILCNISGVNWTLSITVSLVVRGWNSGLV